jgi:hypothetical protein
MIAHCLLHHLVMRQHTSGEIGMRVVDRQVTDRAAPRRAAQRIGIVIADARSTKRRSHLMN